MKKFFSFLTALILVAAMAVTSAAAGLDQKKEQLNDVKEDINAAKQELNEVKKEKNNVRAQLDSIDKDLSSKQRELENIEAQLAKTQDELAATNNELAATEKELADTQANLENLRAELDKAIEEAQRQEALNAERMRAMYMNSTSSYLELLLESKNLNDLLNRVDMITQMISFDQEVLNGLCESRDEVELKKTACEEQEQKIKQTKKKIEEEKEKLKLKEQEIQNTKEKIEQQKQAIESKQAEKEKLLSKLTEEEAKARRELDELEKQSKELEKLIQQLLREQESKNNSKYTGGAMTWPAPGYYTITSPFGNRFHPIAKVYKNHTGIDISGAGINRKPAVAAADGTVIMAQRYGGYGNAVIIDHGGGITTLYGHGYSIKVKVGQKVKKGDTVLLIGSTGNSTGPHLHFEVRKNGSPVNPMNYFK